MGIILGFIAGMILMFIIMIILLNYGLKGIGDILDNFWRLF